MTDGADVGKTLPTVNKLGALLFVHTGHRHNRGSAYRFADGGFLKMRKALSSSLSSMPV